MDVEEVVAPEEPEDVEPELGEEALELDAVDDEPEEEELTASVLRRELEEGFFAAERSTGVFTDTVVAVVLVAAEAARTTCVLPVAMTAVRIAVPAAAAAAVQRVIRLIRRRPAARALL